MSKSCPVAAAMPAQPVLVEIFCGQWWPRFLLETAERLEGLVLQLVGGLARPWLDACRLLPCTTPLSDAWTDDEGNAVKMLIPMRGMLEWDFGRSDCATLTGARS